jgi:hypothetical protein
MPWTPAQHRLFEAAAHDPEIAKRKGIPQNKAAQMASEGIKDAGETRKRTLVRALRGGGSGGIGGGGTGSVGSM